MVLSFEEKERRKLERKLKKWNETHQFINDVDHKLCSMCKKWFPSNKDYFYPNKSNGIDGLNPYCIACTVNKSLDHRNKDHAAYIQYMRTYHHTEERKPIRIELTKEYYRENKEARQEYFKEYREKYPEKFVEYNHERQHKNHDISDKEWIDCKNYFRNSCAYCGMSYDEHKRMYRQDLHREHAIHDGANDLSNCVPSCRVCNSEKHIYHYYDWYSLDNDKFESDRLNRIVQWLEIDYHKFTNREGQIN